MRGAVCVECLGCDRFALFRTLAEHHVPISGQPMQKLLAVAQATSC